MGDAAHSPVNSNPAPISEGIASSSAVYQPTADTPSASEPVRSGPYQHTAFSAQFQMPHSQITCGPFHMSHMVGSLPSSGFRPGQPRYGGQPGTGQMGPMGPMPPGNSHPYYMHQHSPMAYYAPSPISPSQQRDRAGVQPGYYHGQMVMGNSQPMGPGYYYPPTTHYTRGQSQGFQSLNDSALASQSAALSKRGDRPASGIKVTRENDRQGVVRGPPRKPKQSGHAIWIGNLPPQTDLMQLVHHVCREASGLQSLFLISKSNCAFANFKDETACVSAQQKLHDSSFQNVHLVSRLRKNTVESAAGVAAPTGPAATFSTGSGRPSANSGPEDKSDAASQVDDEETKESTPASLDGVALAASTNDTASSEITVNSGAHDSIGEQLVHKDKFFILKSLTVEDLELSISTGIWATQAHNEQTLNEAFKSADNVYLIFSANKSGEYFGYARMTSGINDDPAAAIEFAPKAQSTSDVDLPRAIPTEATEFAPAGRIIDDSARGTIFWEAETEGDEDETSDQPDESEIERHEEDEEEEQKVWGKPFKLEWLSTTRLPFYRTRGLRNPWNSNREVKIARDGTQVEPSVGRRLIGLFNRTQSPVPGGLRSMHAMNAMMAGYPPIGHTHMHLVPAMRPAY